MEDTKITELLFQRNESGLSALKSKYSRLAQHKKDLKQNRLLERVNTALFLRFREAKLLTKSAKPLA